jgi:signal transduction histidine kinase
MLELIPENQINGFFDIFCRVLSTGESVRDQTHFVSSQMHHWFNYVVVPISDNTLVVTIQDISEQKRDEEALKSQKLRLEDSLEDLKIANDNLERFAFAASHDLQEPLRKVQMFSNLLVEHSGEALDEKAQVYIGKILSSTGRMKQLVNDILQFSQQSREVRYDYRVDLNALLTDVESDLEMVIQQRRARITRENLPAVYGNPSQLSQLFHNLYNNALKFSRAEKSETQITVNYRPVAAPTLRDPSRQYIAITVADDGLGFDEKYAEKIFELFSRLHSTTTYAGSGIGLALCKKIAQNHGGDIVASSPKGRGASFDVILPLA